MPRVGGLELGLHPALQAAFAQLYPTVDAYLANLGRSTVPEDTPSGDYTKQAEGALLEYLKTYIAPLPASGTELFSTVQHRSRILPSGCESLDSLLLGGLREGHLTELVGDFATGKTQVCLQFAAASACRRESVIYIDTNASFVASRARDLCAAQISASQTLVSMEEALGRIQVWRCHDLHRLLLILDSISSTCQELPRSGQQQEGIHMLIIDSVASLISPLLGASPGHHGHCLMIKLAAGLKQLAASHNIAVLLTNNTVTDRSGVSRPGLGESWRNQPHTRVLLTYQEGGVPLKRRASLLASPLTALGKAAAFEIGPYGVSNG